MNFFLNKKTAKLWIIGGVGIVVGILIIGYCQILTNPKKRVIQNNDTEIISLLKEIYNENLIGKEYEREIIEIISQRLNAAEKYNRSRAAANMDNFFDGVKNEQNTFEKIYNENYWGSSESRSGGGSSVESTQNVAASLPKIWGKYNIKSFLDVPCGDYNWMKNVDKKNIKYIGGDIVPKMIEVNNKKFKDANVSFEVIDITSNKIPKVDMIFCKDCLQHLSDENVEKALKNFKESGSTYLLVTSYPLTLENWNISNGGYRPLNLLKAPFNFPISSCLEKISEVKKDGNELDKILYLYRLNDLLK